MTKTKSTRRAALLLLMLVLAVVAPGGLSKPEPDPPAPPTLDWPHEAPILATDPVGYLSASTSVGPNGEYRISVPLDVPAGGAGLAPSVALSYGSERGDDVVGVGWTLSAVSGIQRCGANVATEGFTDGVDFTGDRFCLDGAKLVAVSGQYGAPGAEYRTEQEPFSKIVTVGDTDKGPEQFIVYHANGRISTYEALDTVQAEAHLAWLLEKTSDRNGNSISYQYLIEDLDASLGGLSVLLQTISYTHHGLLDGRREVVLHYDGRQDPSFAYLAGVRTRRDKRLSEIEMRAPNPVWTDTVWRYRLQYATSPDTGRSLLTSIRKEDASGASLWAKQFDWAQHTRPSFQHTQLPHDGLFIPKWWWDARVLPIDVDGDGRDELLYRREFWNETPARLRKTLDPALPLQGETHVLSQVNAEYGRGRPIDRQHDGRFEILTRDMDEAGSAVYRAYRWDPIAGQFAPDPGLGGAVETMPVVADFDGSGWTDTLFLPTAENMQAPYPTWQLEIGGPNGFSAPIDSGIDDIGILPQRVGDIDGDGRGDVIMVDRSDAPFPEPPGYFPEHTAAIRIDDDGQIIKDTAWDLGDSRGIVLADVNGDGLKDAVDLSGNVIGTPVRYNTGVDFGPPHLFPDVLVYSPEDRPGVRVADFDRDGREDLLIARHNEFSPSMAVHLSRVAGFEEVAFGYQLQPTDDGGWDTLGVGDFNGDGLPDIVQLFQDVTGNGDANTHLEIWTQMPGESDAIVTVRDEGAAKPRESVSYTRVLDRVQGDSDCQHPQRCVLRGLRVVEEIDTFEQDRIAPQRRMRYRYAGARSDVLGRGFLGFSRVIVNDLDTHALTTTAYDNVTREGMAYPFAGLPGIVETIVPILSQNGSEGGVLTTLDGAATARVHRTEVSYASSWGYGAQAYFVRPFRSVETEWEQPCDITASEAKLVGAAPPPARTLRRTFTYDDYGNPTFLAHDTEGGVHGEVSQVFENRTNGDWLLGLLRESYSTEGEANSTSVTRVVFKDYDADGLLRHVVREPFEPTFQRTTTLKYDDRGLVTKITESAPGSLDRRTFLFHDEEGVFVEAMENEVGHVLQRLVHPAFGTPLVVQDENGTQTHLHYDGLGRLRQVERDGGLMTDVQYLMWGWPGDIRGVQLRATSSDGSEAYRSIDPLGRAREEGTKAFDGTWSVSTVSYTPRGQIFASTMPGAGAPGPATLVQHDTLGRVEWILPPDGVLTTFTHEMFRWTSVDSQNRVRRADLDHDLRPVETHEYADDGHDIPVRYRYGDFGNLVQVADAEGHLTTFGYDKLGRRNTLSDPDGGQTSFEYSGFDEVSRVSDAIHDVTYRYDGIGRVVAKEDTHGSPAFTELSTFEYDIGVGALGRLFRATSPDGVVTSVEYDTFGQPVSTKWTIGAETFAVEQVYGLDGRAEEIRYPEVNGRDRFFVKLHYNTHGYLDIVGKDANSFVDPFWRVLARGADGGLAEAMWADGGPTEKRSYDVASGRLSRVRIESAAPNGPDPLFDIAYQYEGSDIATRTDSVMGRQEAFQYDALDRLEKWTLSGTGDRKVEYGYDDLGNLTTVLSAVGGQEQPAETLAYDDAAHAHAASERTVGGGSGVPYHYDSRGRMFEGAGRGITWTSFDLPRAISDSNGTTMFTYDAFGTRVKKSRVVPGQPTETTITLGELYERRTVGGQNEHHFFVHGDGEPVTEVVYRENDEKEEALLLGRDGHGSVGVVMEEDGQVRERLYYEPFGARVTAAGDPLGASASGVPWGFTGHREDDDLGLIDMRGRIYDPGLRRFLSPDPIVHDVLVGQTLNRYSYVWNNPLSYVDPTGFDPVVETRVIPYTVLEEGGGYSESGRVETVFVTDSGRPAGNEVVKKPLLPGPGPAVAPAAETQPDPGAQAPEPVVPFQAGLIAPELIPRPPPMGAETPLAVVLGDPGPTQTSPGSGEGADTTRTEPNEDSDRSSTKKVVKVVVGAPLMLFPALTMVAVPLVVLGVVSNPLQAVETSILSGVTVTPRGQAPMTGNVNLGPTLDRIAKGGSFPHKNDGSVFANKEGRLPSQPPGYYREYVHPTPGTPGPGPQRIVVGAGGELYYTPDHYQTFVPLN